MIIFSCIGGREKEINKIYLKIEEKKSRYFHKDSTLIAAYLGYQIEWTNK